MAKAPDVITKRGMLAFVIIMLIVFIALLVQTQRDAVRGVLNSGFHANPATVGPYYKVTRVIDGDTLVLDMNGTEEKVRLIGINTPEAVDPRQPVQCYGQEASKRMKDLAEGELVRLESDDSQSVRDIYGRLLDYVYLQDGEMLNRKMIAEGYAYEYTYLTPYKYQEDFRSVQTFARLSNRGLWSPDTCNGKE